MPNIRITDHWTDEPFAKMREVIDLIEAGGYGVQEWHLDAPLKNGSLDSGGEKLTITVPLNRKRVKAAASR